jgi:broad specificity phosphatase PhoE
LGGGLTALGKQQAKRLAQRLRTFPANMIHHSTLRRAVETTRIIARALPDVPLRPARVLQECIPCVPLEFADHFANVSPEALERDGRQAQRALARYFVPARSERHGIIVSHGNLIRYFVCTALGAPVESWANADINQCGLSIVRVEPDGRRKLLTFNDTGHLPDHMLTFI